ncbi:MAG TPA: hypothetical protein CFH84_06225 [Sulfurimonas sp. UBA12504]|nr:MAG TPA: hypothetical protein CFH84_06225 [Sulfurimonas sp. UBA12504]
MINKIALQIKNFFSTNKLSYIFYIISTLLLFIPSIILFFINPQYFKLYSDFVIQYILIPAYSIGFLIDAFSIVKSLWKTFIGKLFYSILGYFAFTFSQSMAKQSIYSITHENPDFFQTSIQFLSAIYLIPSWLIYINYIISFVAIFISIVLLIVTPFKLDKITLYLNKIFDLVHMNIEIKKQNIVHLFFIPISSMTFFIYSFSFFPLIDKVIDNNFIKESILKYSYYPNNVCTNIPSGTYIKLIGTNNVSMTNINTYNYTFLSTSLLNESITFETSTCERTQKHIARQGSQ